MIGTQGFTTWSSRWLLIGMLALGISSLQAGRGTLAFFTSTVSSTANVFTAGTLDVTTSTINSATPGSFTTDPTFQWNTEYGGTNCSTKLTTSTLITNQRIAPGQYCTAAITLTNSGNLDMWGRLRLVRSTTTDGAVNDALNSRLIFFMAEYANSGAQTTACAPGTFTFTPSASTSAATITTTGTVLTSLGTTGKVVGSNGTLTASHTFMGLTTGTGGAPAEANMNATTKYYNLFGSDEVASPTAGTNNNGTIAEGLFTAGTSKYYCAAVFFPSDSGISASDTLTGVVPGNSLYDNAAQGGSNQYYLHFIGAQRSGR